MSPIHMLVVGRGLIANELTRQLEAVFPKNLLVTTIREDMLPMYPITPDNVSMIVLCSGAESSARLAEDLKPHTASIPVVDMSPMFRTDPDWHYSMDHWNNDLPDEFFQHQKLYSMPGCFASAVLYALQPLVTRHLTRRLTHIHVSGWGGRSVLGAVGVTMAKDLPLQMSVSREHRHIPEIKMRSQFGGPIIFCPTICDYESGIMTQFWVPERFDTIESALNAEYEGSDYVKVTDCPSTAYGPYDMAGSDDVFINLAKHDQGTLITTQMDNLRAGSCGQVIKLIRRMFK